MQCTPIALTDIMISDLPHILYSKKEELSDEEIDNRRVVEKHMNDEIKQGGLMSVAGLNLGGFHFGKNDQSNAAQMLSSGALKK